MQMLRTHVLCCVARYEALRNGPKWNSTLFILTYDEHGGFFDHVPPPQTGVPNPDGILTKGGFNFTRYAKRHLLICFVHLLAVCVLNVTFIVWCVVRTRPYSFADVPMVPPPTPFGRTVCDDQGRLHSPVTSMHKNTSRRLPVAYLFCCVHHHTTNNNTPPPNGVSRLGIRIPTIAISPWIEKGVLVHEPPAGQKPQPTSQWELSSIPATVQKLLKLKGSVLARGTWHAKVDGCSLSRSFLLLAMTFRTFLVSEPCVRLAAND